MKHFDTGSSSFPRMREDGSHYVDKSLLIKDILDRGGNEVFLFTRPRRFGKTVNLSMLDAFFNLRYKGNSWFEGLAISDHHEYDSYKNVFPVIKLDLKDLRTKSYDVFLGSMRAAILDCYDYHRDYLESGSASEEVVNIYKSLKSFSIGEDVLPYSIKILSRDLHRYHGVQTMILIDEYDRAVADAFGEGNQKQIIEFIGTLMSSSLKGNDSLRMAYVTGVMHIAKASIFSGLNNMSENNVFSVMSDERFGFTGPEVMDLLSQHGRTDCFEEVRSWYDGYRFGDAEVYNPFSIAKYISNDFKPYPYWINTAKDVAVRWLLDRTSMETFGEILDIVNGGEAVTELDGAMTYGDIGYDMRSLYSLMVMSGYLKAVPCENGFYRVSIPNEEVMGMVERMIDSCSPIDDGIFREFNIAVRDKDCVTMTEKLQSILSDASYLILRDEYDYQMVLLTMMHSMSRIYSIKTEYEAGNGRLDIILMPKRDGIDPMIFELKKVKDKDMLNRSAEEALVQIHDRRYHNGMSGEVVLFGISFWGKFPKVVTETIQV